MRQGDLSRDDRVLVGDVRLRVLAAVLELDGESHLELVEVDVARFPIDADPPADLPSLLYCELPCGHPAPSSRNRVPATLTLDVERACPAPDRGRAVEQQLPLSGRGTTPPRCSGRRSNRQFGQNHAADATSLWPSGLRFARSAKTETPIE